MAKKWGTPLVFQYSFPATISYSERANTLPAIPGLLVKLTGLVVKKILIHIMHRADHVLPISEWMKADLVEWGIPSEKMTSFPMGFNENVLVENYDGRNIRVKLNPHNYPSVIYFGAMDRRRNLDFLLRAMRLVINRIPDAQLFMVGGNHSEISKLRETAQKLDINNNIIFTGYVPHHEMPQYILAADIGVSPIPPIPLYIVSSPTKLAETLGLGRPIVCNDIPEQAKILKESGGGISVPYTEKAFAKAILKLLESPDLQSEMGFMGQKYIVEKRSYRIMAKKLEDLYFSLLSN